MEWRPVFIERRCGALERVKLSVHRVVDWVLRCGDIDSRYVDASTMQQGAAAHRKIQKAMTGDYRKEVSLSLLRT